MKEINIKLTRLKEYLTVCIRVKNKIRKTDSQYAGQIKQNPRINPETLLIKYDRKIQRWN